MRPPRDDVGATAPLRSWAKRENLETGFKNFVLKRAQAEDIIWPGLSYVCHIRSTAETVLQGYLTYKKMRPLKTLQKDYLGFYGGPGMSDVVPGMGLLYRVASLVRSTPPIGPYSRPMPRALWWL